MSFDHIVERLQQKSALWVAVGGAREIHPHIRKVHTGAVRIAMQCGDVWLVPIHLAFEAHCQMRSAVLVEVGEPLHIVHGDTSSEQGREEVRFLTKLLEQKLLPLTNWIPVSKDDFGKKGWRGAGETRAAIEEWSKVRVVDSLLCLQLLMTGQQITWPDRVARLRRALQCIMQHSQENGLEQTMMAFQDFAEVAGSKGVSVFQPPSGTYWDMPMSLKAIPRANQRDTGGPWKKLPALRNFVQGVHVHGSLVGANRDSLLQEECRRLMERSKALLALIDLNEEKRRRSQDSQVVALI